MSEELKKTLYKGYVILNPKQMGAIQSRFPEKDLTLISAWRKVGEEEGDEVEVNTSDMEKLRADIKTLGYNPMPISGFGKALKRKYRGLPDLSFLTHRLQSIPET